MSSSSSSSNRGELVKVAYAPTVMEAEMIQGLLADHGIPSLIKRPYSVGGAIWPVIGAHQILVSEAVAEEAREVLEGAPGAD